MLLREILQSKPSRLVTIADTVSLQKAGEELNRQGVGMLLVTAPDGHFVGMLSERDFVHFVSRHGHRALSLQVRNAMVEVTITASPTNSVTDIMRIMTEQRMRHLPVLDGATLVGVISIGDILHSRVAEKDLEATVLRDLARTSPVVAA